MSQDWRDLTYLLHGTATQQAAYHALRSLQIFDLLRHFDPILAGTIPLNVDIPSSDLDIVCQVINVYAFSQYLSHAFGQFADFSLRQLVMQGQPTAIASFTYHDFPIEIFGQARPVMEQAAVRHLLVEAQLLRYGGETVRQQVRQLKVQGLKTEPAFANVFSLDGDPYQVLLDLSEQPQEVLTSIVFTSFPSFVL